MSHQFYVRYRWEELLPWAHVDPASLPAVPSKEQLRSGRFHPVIRMSKVNGGREFVWMRKGLIPSYACDERGAEGRAEAHAESMTCDACFRSAFRRRRCLVPANSIVERRHLGTGIEQPCVFELESGGVFAMAGLWETWINDQGHAVESFALVTALVVPALRTLFDRMPVILTDRAEQERWLLTSSDQGHPPLDLLKPLSVTQLREWRMTPGAVDLHLEAVAGEHGAAV